MGLNTSMSAMLHGMNAERIAIDPKRCISVRHKNASCQRCVDSCASGALYRDGDDILVDADKCIGCGTCANACPTAAISLSFPSPAQISKAAKASLVKYGGSAIFCCETFATAFEKANAHQLEAANICVLPCLGHIDEALLAELAARKAKCVYIVHGECSACDHVRGGELCKQVCKEAQQLLQAFESECKIEYTDVMPAEVFEALKQLPKSNDSASGTDSTLFSLEAKDNSKSQDEGDSNKYSLSDLYNKVGKNGTLSHHIPMKRTRLFNCLSRLGKPKGGDIETRLAGRVSIDTEKCMSCRMCSVFCPTGALLKHGDGKNEDEEFGLMHRPSLCMQCRCCEQICAKEAITIDSKLSLEEFLGKEEIFIELPHPKWQPNTPDSMYNKFADWLGPDINTGHF